VNDSLLNIQEASLVPSAVGETSIASIKFITPEVIPVHNAKIEVTFHGDFNLNDVSVRDDEIDVEAYPGLEVNPALEKKFTVKVTCQVVGAKKVVITLSGEEQEKIPANFAISFVLKNIKNPGSEEKKPSFLIYTRSGTKTLSHGSYHFPNIVKPKLDFSKVLLRKKKKQVV